MRRCNYGSGRGGPHPKRRSTLSNLPALCMSSLWLRRSNYANGDVIGFSKTNSSDTCCSNVSPYRVVSVVGPLATHQTAASRQSAGARSLIR